MIHHSHICYNNRNEVVLKISFMYKADIEEDYII